MALAPAQAARRNLLTALLVPKTGPHAALGRSMERAAIMAQGAIDTRTLKVFDTLGTAEGAAAAAGAARKARASVVVGPVFAAEVGAALGVLGSEAPLIAFTNDVHLVDRGAFLMGLTAPQVVNAIMAYAARRGVRRFAIGGTNEGWDGQVRSAATVSGVSLGVTTSAFQGFPAIIDAAGEGLPDAILMPSVAALLEAAPAAAANGVQLLAALPSLDLSADTLRRVDGLWLAAPDPEPFAAFSRAFEARNGSRPGLIAGLAYDAMRIVAQMRLSGGTDRSALLVPSGFKAVCGDVRFRDDGSASRALAILAAGNGELRIVAPAAFP